MPPTHKPHDVTAAQRAWADRVKALRLRAGQTQEWLGERAGVHASTICRVELGQIVPSDELKFGLADALGVAVHELFAYTARSA